MNDSSGTRSAFVRKGRLLDDEAHSTRPSDPSRRKISIETLRCSGVVPSPFNGWPSISTGSAALDEAISVGAAGLPLGSVWALEEDEITQHYRGWLGYIAAEGLVHGHAVALAIPDEDPAAVFKSIPRAVGVSEKSADPGPEKNSQDMKIAWRYEQSSMGSSSSMKSNSELHRRWLFDCSQGTEMEVESQPVSLLSRETVHRCGGLDGLVDIIRSHCQNAEDNRLVSRVIVRSIDSTLWCTPDGTSDANIIPKTVARLRKIARLGHSVIIVTYQARSVNEKSLFALRHLCDGVISLETFRGNGTIAAGFGDHHGLMHLLKLPPFSGVSSLRREYRSLAFKRGRRKYHLELALPAPEVDHATSFETGKVQGTSDSNALDF